MKRSYPKKGSYAYRQRQLALLRSKRAKFMRDHPQLYAQSYENKFHDVTVDGGTLPTAGTVFNSLNLIAQGVTETTRIGRKCTIRSIDWRNKVTLPATVDPADTSDTVRLILFLDKQANGATATVLDILETADYLSFNNLSNKNRFRILCDKWVSLTSKSGAWDGTNDNYGEDTRIVKVHKDVNIPIEFSSTTGAITEVRSNNLGICMLSSHGLAAHSSLVRIRFSDR